MSTKRSWTIGLVVAAAAIGAATLIPNRVFNRAYAQQAAQSKAAAEGLSTAKDLSASFEMVAEVIRPSIVSISSARRVTATREPMARSPFRDFFGDDYFERVPAPRDRVERGLGTGVIVRQDGYILTNNHVVGNADEVTITLPDERELRAKVVGTDPKTDLAVIKIEARGLHPAKLGNSGPLRIGEWVIAAGNPFGLTSSISAGIVSAKGRAIGVTDYEDFIQTDAAINPGNSGGPLVNLRGEVVGINTAIFSRSGGYMGIGFAIPVNMAQSMMNSLMTQGRVVRGQLGVVIQDLDPGLARSFGYSGTQGVVVGDVTSGGPADRAGIRPGDIITRFDGQPVTSVASLRERAAATAPGRRVPVEIFKDGKSRAVTVVIEEQDAPAAARPAADETTDLGFVLRTLTAAEARQLGMTGTFNGGVLIQDVRPLGAADRAGLTPGTVIVSVQGEPVRTIADFQRALERHDPKQGVRLEVHGRDGRRYVFVQTGGTS